jgi:hypothetical protein
MAIRVTRSPGMVLIAVWLILTGIAVLALLAGLLILIGR